MVAATPVAMLYPTLVTSLLSINYTIFPDEDSVPHLIRLNYTPLTLEEINILAADVNSTVFTLYTRRNPTNGQVITTNNINSVSKSFWNANKPTILVIHGWKSGGDKSACTLVRDAFLKILDCNVIVIDWSAIAKNIIYSQVAKSVPTVAEHVASFINYLRLHANLNPNNMKIIGHSLGAHVASLAARIVSRSSLVAEVIALDPAKPMFENNGPDGRVDRSHARNVQVVHTSARILGMSAAVGTSDFYANGGSSQPGCSNDMLGGCAHGRSYEYYSESVTKPRGFPGNPQNGGSRAYMGGANLDPNARGSYDFKTGSQPPYALG